jgi:hypothetical protein
VTRGKYANAAEKRRAQEDLERRAADAERERDRLAIDLAALRESSEREASVLRGQVRTLQEQRDDAAAPRILQLEQINNRLRAERGAALFSYDHEIKEQVAVTGRFTDLLTTRFGLGGPEARELIDAIWNAPQSGERHISRVGVYGKDLQTIERVQRTRGMRGTGNPAQEAAPEARTILYDRKQIKAVIRDARELLIASGIPLYVYDGEESSLVVGAPGEWLEISIESADGLTRIAMPSGERARLAQAILPRGSEDS